MHVNTNALNFAYYDSSSSSDGQDIPLVKKRLKLLLGPRYQKQLVDGNRELIYPQIVMCHFLVTNTYHQCLIFEAHDKN